MNTITTVLLDLSEVLISGLLGTERELAPRLGVPAETLMKRFGGDRLRQLCRGDLTEDEYLRQIRKSEGWAVPIRELKAALRRNFRRTIDGMPALLERLARQPVTLVLVSDHAREWIAHIERIHPFLERFHRRVYSFETRLIKDEPACFPALLAALGREGRECVFVDDHPRNVEQARQAGIHGIVFQGSERLEQELAELGVLPAATCGSSKALPGRAARRSRGKP
jgi:HAD superfamily hydrolase (TIGR01509 family)